MGKLRRKTRELLEKAREYTNDQGRVVRPMPEELMGQLRRHKMAIGIELNKADPELGTRARWFVLYPEVRQTILEAAARLHKGQGEPHVLEEYRQRWGSESEKQLTGAKRG